MVGNQPIGGVCAHSVGEHYPFVIYAKGRIPGYVWHVKGAGFDSADNGGSGFIVQQHAVTLALMLKACYDHKRSRDSA